MLIGTLMILAPILAFVVSFSYASRLNPKLCAAYRIVGGIVVFLGGGVSIYFAAYTGDQGGIAAFYFQILVILVYVMFSVTLVVLNWMLRDKSLDKPES